MDYVLIDGGCNINATDNSGNTALHLALKLGSNVWLISILAFFFNFALYESASYIMIAKINF